MENLKSNLVLIETVPEAQTASPTQPEAAGDNPGTAEVTSAEKALLGNTAQKIGGLAEQEEGRKVSKEQLVNRLNFINFQDDVIHSSLHPSRVRANAAADGRSRSRVWETPWNCDGWAQRMWTPCSSPTISISFWSPAGRNSSSQSRRYSKSMEQGARLALPEISRETSHRKVERQCCRDISVYVLQNSSSFSGTLLDFTASSFRTELKAFRRKASTGLIPPARSTSSCSQATRPFSPASARSSAARRARTPAVMCWNP